VKGVIWTDTVDVVDPARRCHNRNESGEHAGWRESWARARQHPTSNITPRVRWYRVAARSGSAQHPMKNLRLRR